MSIAEPIEPFSAAADYFDKLHQKPRESMILISASAVFAATAHGAQPRKERFENRDP